MSWKFQAIFNISDGNWKRSWEKTRATGNRHNTHSELEIYKIGSIANAIRHYLNDNASLSYHSTCTISYLIITIIGNNRDSYSYKLAVFSNFGLLCICSRGSKQRETLALYTSERGSYHLMSIPFVLLVWNEIDCLFYLRKHFFCFLLWAASCKSQ